MKTKTKTFDCVAMKQNIQERLQKEYKGLSFSEMKSRIEKTLISTDSPVGKLWRELNKDKHG